MIRKIYLYLVLFATLMMTIGGSVSVFMNLADLIAPTPYYMSYEEYRMYQVPKEDTAATLSEEEIRAAYDRMVEETRQQEINRSLNSIIKSLGWIVIPLPVFIYYQRKLNRSE